MWLNRCSRPSASSCGALFIMFDLSQNWQCFINTVESGKKCDFFELFCVYQLVLVVWNTFGAKFKLSFISWVKQIWQFLWQWRKKLPFPHLGGLLGETGVREKSFLRSLGFSTLARLVSFYSITVPLVQFFWCSPCLPWQRWPIRVRCPRIRGYKHLRPVEHIFHCLSNVWFFRQAHKRPTNLDDQFLEILTCWTRWQASFFIILKGKTSKPGQMSSSFRKIFEAEKIWQK